MNTKTYIDSVIQKIELEGLLRNRRVYHEGINLATNDYLNLRNHPKVLRAAIDSLLKYGPTSGGSPVVNGFFPIHEELEEELADWHKGGHALLWTSGFSLNYNLLKHLPQKNDTVIADKLMHHSAIKGAIESKAKLKRFHHNDLNHLEVLLKEANGNRFVAMESVYSMDGDYVDLKEVANLKRKYEFTWILDEAHAIGWYGAGLAVETGVIDEVDIVVGTLGKALVSIGGYAIFKDPNFKKFMINTAREFFYSTYPSPATVGASLGALRVIRDELEDYRHLWKTESIKIRTSLRSIFKNINHFDTPIIPCIIGNNEDVIKIGNYLIENKIAVGIIRPPSVPLNTARLRLSINKDMHSNFFDNEIIPILKGIT